MFTLCGIALVPVEFINISHTTYNIGFLFTHTNSWPLCHSLPGTVWTGIRTIVEVKKVWSRIGTYWDGSKKNRSGDLYLFHQTVSANHSSTMLNVCEQCVPFPARAVHAIPQTRRPVLQCTYEMIKMPRAGVFFHEVNFWLTPFFSTCSDFCSSGPSCSKADLC